MDALALKEIGNEEFKKQNFRQAIDYYSQAISKSNDPNIIYSNRAQCYRKLFDWQKCYEDSLEAIELHEFNIKAQMLCGQSLLELGKLDSTLEKIENGLKRLTRAYSLCSSQNKRNFEKDILIYIARGKKLLWYKKKEVELKEKQELFQYIQKSEENNKKVPEIQKKNNLEELRMILFESEKEQSIPEFMTDFVSKKIMLDPVILPSGNSYDKESLQKYFTLNGNFDPVTKDRVDASMIFKNLTLKKIIEEFMECNPWAYEWNGKEDYRNIQF